MTLAYLLSPHYHPSPTPPPASPATSSLTSAPHPPCSFWQPSWWSTTWPTWTQSRIPAWCLWNQQPLRPFHSSLEECPRTPRRSTRSEEETSMSSCAETQELPSLSSWSMCRRLLLGPSFPQDREPLLLGSWVDCLCAEKSAHQGTDPVGRSSCDGWQGDLPHWRVWWRRSTCPGMSSLKFAV